MSATGLDPDTAVVSVAGYRGDKIIPHRAQSVNTDKSFSRKMWKTHFLKSGKNFGMYRFSMPRAVKNGRDNAECGKSCGNCGKQKYRAGYCTYKSGKLANVK